MNAPTTDALAARRRVWQALLRSAATQPAQITTMMVDVCSADQIGDALAVADTELAAAMAVVVERFGLAATPDQWVAAAFAPAGVLVTDTNLARNLVMRASARAGGVVLPAGELLEHHEPGVVLEAMAAVTLALIRVHASLSHTATEQACDDIARACTRLLHDRGLPVTAP